MVIVEVKNKLELMVRVKVAVILVLVVEVDVIVVVVNCDDVNVEVIEDVEKDEIVTVNVTSKIVLLVDTESE